MNDLRTNDLSEQDDSHLVKAEIPGVRKEDIDVRIDGNPVTISAEVKKETEDKKEGRCQVRQWRARTDAAQESHDRTQAPVDRLTGPV